MNKQSSNSSLRNKIFLSFWFIVFAILILLVSWLFRIPILRGEDLLLKLNDTDKQITLLMSLHAKYLLNNDKEDNLFTVSSDNTEDEIKNVSQNINQQIVFLKNYPLTSRNPAIFNAVNEFSNRLAAFVANLNNFILIVKERGNKHSGLVAQWIEISETMQTLANQKSNSYQQKINQIKELENDYLLNRNIKTLEDIAVLVEELRSEINPDETAINIDDIDAYNILTGHLIGIEKRLGHSDAHGILADLENSLKKLPVSFISINKLFEDHLTKAHIFWTIGRYTSVALIVVLFVYLFIKVFSVLDPLQRMSSFTKKLADGEFPEGSYSGGKMQDFQIISDNLEKHVASLHEKYEFIQSINQDNLSVSFTLAGKNDLLGMELIKVQKKLLYTFEEQARTEEDNKVRRYINEGLAKFADILRSQSEDFTKLGDDFIRELVKYLNAVQGGLFILDTNESGKVLNLLSSFAYNRKKYLTKSIAYGEGLIGTCAREKQSINLTEIPEGYIIITSGLGDTTPKNLLLIPVMHENEIYGVIEIASLNVYQKHEITFTEQVALSLGTTIVNSRNNQKTAELLSKSQRQALEMAEQEEEMRQNMEELKATQEESSRREEELKELNDAAKKSFYIITYDLEGKISDINDICCDFLNLKKKDALGKDHQEVFKGSVKSDAAFLNEIQTNGSLLITENIHLGRKSIQLHEHFTTILNRDNIPVKYINFATDGRTGNS